MNLVVRVLSSPTVGAQTIEVVERKGIGHPDTLCDGVAEHVSVALCRHYLKEFGVILHHNVDKVLLCGGSARAAFGGGEVREPIVIYLAGRATAEFGGRNVDVNAIAVAACREWLRAHLRALDVDRDVQIVPRLRPGSADLTALFARAGAPLSNDTSCGAGFAPFTDLERVVLAVERHLNAKSVKDLNPEIGEDVKVMGVRNGARISLTIGCAFIGRFLRDAEDYLRAKERARDLALEAARRETGLDVDAVVNAADDVPAGELFLTVTGTSAEAGDDGEVGRGNRASGLITPYRPMTLEAAAGKNPVTHVGKLYNLAAGRIAEALARVPSVKDAACVLVSQIGRPVADPQIVDVALHVGEAATEPPEATVRDAVRSELSRLGELREALLEERIAVY